MAHSQTQLHAQDGERRRLRLPIRYLLGLLILPLHELFILGATALSFFVVAIWTNDFGDACLISIAILVLLSWTVPQVEEVFGMRGVIAIDIETKWRVLAQNGGVPFVYFEEGRFWLRPDMSRYPWFVLYGDSLAEVMTKGVRWLRTGKAA